jgi:hypothetical protein
MDIEMENRQNVETIQNASNDLEYFTVTKVIFFYSLSVGNITNSIELIKIRGKNTIFATRYFDFLNETTCLCN